MIDSKYFGVPQSRPRCYIVAIQNKFSKKFSFPLGNGITKYIKDVINVGDNSIPVSDKWNFYIDLYQKKINADEVPFNIPKTRKSLERVSKNCDLFDCVLQMRSNGVRAYSIDTQFPTFAVSVSGGGYDTNINERTTSSKFIRNEKTYGLS